MEREKTPIIKRLKDSKYRRIEKDTQAIRMGVLRVVIKQLEEHESLKLDIWAEYMARETNTCPDEFGKDVDCDLPHVGNTEREYDCVPCWQRFAHGEK